MSVKGSVSARLSVTETNADTLTSPSWTAAIDRTTQVSATGDIDADYQWWGARTTASETLDVTNLTHPITGATVNFGTVKGIAIYNAHATATLTVGGGTNPLFNQLPVIQAGGYVLLRLNITTSGTVKNIVVTGSASLTYHIIIFGD